MTPGVIPSPKTGRELVDEYFIENRTRLLEIAAFLDRLDRTDASLVDRDYRVRAFREAIRLLEDRPSAAERRRPASSASSTSSATRPPSRSRSST